MKKVVYLFVVILIIGLLLALLGFAALGFDAKAAGAVFVNQRDDDFSAVSKTIDFLPQKLELDCINNNIEFFTAEEDKITLDYYQSDYYYFELTENSEVAKLKAVKKHQFWLKNWAFEIGTLSPEIVKVKVGLAKNFSGELVVKTVNGNIKLHNSNEFESFSIKVTNGKVDVKNASVVTDSSIETVNGNIQIESFAAKSISASNTNGSIKLSKLQAQTISTQTVNGNTTIKNTTCPNIEAKATNGNITINPAGRFEDYRVKVSNNVGSIKINDIKYASQTFHPSATKYISADNNTGNIAIDFEE